MYVWLLLNSWRVRYYHEAVWIWLWYSVWGKRIPTTVMSYMWGSPSCSPPCLTNARITCRDEGGHPKSKDLFRISQKCGLVLMASLADCCLACQSWCKGSMPSLRSRGNFKAISAVLVVTKISWRQEFCQIVLFYSWMIVQRKWIRKTYLYVTCFVDMAVLWKLFMKHCLCHVAVSLTDQPYYECFAFVGVFFQVTGVLKWST